MEMQNARKLIRIRHSAFPFSVLHSAFYTSAMRPFRSPAPGVKLVNAFARPFENAVATARTCYSGKGIVWPEDVSGDGESDEKRQKRSEQRDRIARSTYE